MAGFWTQDKAREGEEHSLILGALASLGRGLSAHRRGDTQASAANEAQMNRRIRGAKKLQEARNDARGRRWRF